LINIYFLQINYAKVQKSIFSKYKKAINNNQLEGAIGGAIKEVSKVFRACTFG
jgi:hypothetical protein